MHSGRREEGVGGEDWYGEELAGVDLGDKRLNVRIVETMARLAAQPEAAINLACEDWADTKASYRLFGNERVTPEEILAPHRAGLPRRRTGSHHPSITDAVDCCEIGGSVGAGGS